MGRSIIDDFGSGGTGVVAGPGGGIGIIGALITDIARPIDILVTLIGIGNSQPLCGARCCGRDGCSDRWPLASGGGDVGQHREKILFGRCGNWKCTANETQNH